MELEIYLIGGGIKVYSLKDGETLIRAARKCIEQYCANPKADLTFISNALSAFDQNSGIFVTLELYPSKELRGCIGFPRAIEPIKRSVIEAAISAAFEDPRFGPLSSAELGKLTIEISILSILFKIEGNPDKRRSEVKIGRDGLMLQYGVYSGLLLPVVPIEQGWGVDEFLSETCVKAGLPENYWMQQNVQLYKFESQVFREEEPAGKVVELDLEAMASRKT
jgi:uncharacterized protein (TIGR00296 family)